MNTVIVIDSCSDLPRDFVEKNNIPALGINVKLNEIEFVDDFGKTVTYKEFYDAVREGEMPTTAQVNSEVYKEEFLKHVKQNKSVIYLAFSSALSGSINSANIAKDEILEEYENADITIIDTKSASLGEGLIVYYAYDMLKKGCSKEEIVNWVEKNKLKVNHWVIADDLNHLKRGGRISGTQAVVGTLLNIKPVINVDDEGRLIPVAKVKGRKKALKTLVDKFREKVVNPEEQVIFISHSDCASDAELVKNMILEEFKVKDFIINQIGPGIGSHTGPGTVTLFFMGDSR
ncbi:DegV family protein with EDD domain [Clostridium pascui]|uniref:DegV family protein n=1 Tax=Clostridium pascui TaxID=46609 RepID=UPI00195DE42B|nr:DegV family protein [Clostridium pascui]MBM7870416.1 DegV family protein with EDD domain [Clostridium pascui]